MNEAASVAEDRQYGLRRAVVLYDFAQTLGVSFLSLTHSANIGLIDWATICLD